MHGRLEPRTGRRARRPAATARLAASRRSRRSAARWRAARSAAAAARSSCVGPAGERPRRAPPRCARPAGPPSRRWRRAQRSARSLPARVVLRLGGSAVVDAASASAQLLPELAPAGPGPSRRACRARRWPASSRSASPRRPGPRAEAGRAARRPQPAARVGLVQSGQRLRPGCLAASLGLSRDSRAGGRLVHRARPRPGRGRLVDGRLHLEQARRPARPACAQCGPTSPVPGHRRRPGWSRDEPACLRRGRRDHGDARAAGRRSAGRHAGGARPVTTVQGVSGTPAGRAEAAAVDAAPAVRRPAAWPARPASSAASR